MKVLGVNEITDNEDVIMIIIKFHNVDIDLAQKNLLNM